MGKENNDSWVIWNGQNTVHSYTIDLDVHIVDRKSNGNWWDWFSLQNVLNPQFNINPANLNRLQIAHLQWKRISQIWYIKYTDRNTAIVFAWIISSTHISMETDLKQKSIYQK